MASQLQHSNGERELERYEQSDLERDSRGGRDASHNSDDREVFFVRFGEKDPEDPRNFSSWKKAWITTQMSFMALAGSLGTSITSPAQAAISAYMDVDMDMTVLSLSLFVLGFAFGPLIWAPIGEVYGRRWSMLPAIFVLSLFSIGSALTHDAPSLFVTRFLGGLFGSAPISNASAALGDLYDPATRGIPMAFLAMVVVGGPCLAPLIGAVLIENPKLGWRWTEYLEAILSLVSFIVALVAMPESYKPVLLTHKARRMRAATGDDRYWHPHETEGINAQNIATKYFSRPLRMFFTEPMLTCLCLYASFVYGLLFLTLEVFPIVFQEQRRWTLVVSTLPFLGLFIGVLCALVINISNQPIYKRNVEKNHGQAVPEARLPPMIIGGFLFSAGLFWFGWTAASAYSWVLPVVAAGCIGAGFNIVFQQSLNFIVDTYGPYAASAVAANTFLRSLLACALPLAARPMFLNMGTGPAASLLGGISCLALPIPFIFMKYGAKLRAMSRFTPMPEG